VDKYILASGSRGFKECLQRDPSNVTWLGLGGGFQKSIKKRYSFLPVANRILTEFLLSYIESSKNYFTEKNIFAFFFIYVFGFVIYMKISVKPDLELLA